MKDAFFPLFFRARIFLPTHFRQVICFATFRAFLFKHDAFTTRSFGFHATVLAFHKLWSALVFASGSLIYSMTKRIHIFFATHGLHLCGRCRPLIGMYKCTAAALIQLLGVVFFSFPCRECHTRCYLELTRPKFHVLARALLAIRYASNDSPVS